MPQSLEISPAIARKRAVVIAPQKEVQPITPKRIIMIRHMKAEHNANGWLVGQIDTPLTSEGIIQAQSMQERLANEPLALIVSSDTQRAGQTAKVVQGLRRTSILATSLIRERDYGVLEELKMTPKEFFGSQYAENLRVLLQSDIFPEEAHIELVPGWETDSKLVERMEMAIKLTEAFLLPGQTALIVSHAHAMRAWLESKTDLQLDGSGSIPHGSGVIIELTESLRRIAKIIGRIRIHKITKEDDEFIRITRRYMRLP